MSYQDLQVFREAYQLSLEIHKLSLEFPAVEQYELAPQLRKATKSVAVNIAEGMGKQGSKAEKKRFLRIALGSYEESKVWLEYCRDLSYLSEPECRKFQAGYSEIARMINGLIRRYD